MRTNKKELNKFLERSAQVVAKDLLGSYLERTFDDGSISIVKIVETEAYDQSDPASHSYNGMTPRTEVMFGEAGYLYVYFTYGMHYCCNIVVGGKGHGAAVLIRAVEPLQGVDELIKNRKSKKDTELTNGPAKLCQSLKIDQSMNRHDLTKTPLRLIINPKSSEGVTEANRIGITKGKDLLWRFYLTESKYISKR